MHQGSHGVKVPHGRAPMQCRQSVLVCCLCGRPCQLPVSWRTPVTVVGALRKHLCARGRGGGQGSCESADAKQQAGAGTAADAGAGQGDRTGQKDKKSQKDKKGTNGTNGTNGTMVQEGLDRSLVSAQRRAHERRAALAVPRVHFGAKQKQ
jgi:hypothetical protein